VGFLFLRRKASGRILSSQAADIDSNFVVCSASCVFSVKLAPCTMPPPLPVLQECEIPIMIIECCSQEKTFVRYYALLGSRFCMLRKEFQVGQDVALISSITGCAFVTLPSHWFGMLQKAHRYSNYIRLYRALLLYDTIEFQNYFIRTTEVLFFTFLSRNSCTIDHPVLFI
jgi:hypothetical protein